MNPTNEDILALASKAMITRTVVAKVLQDASEAEKQFLYDLLQREVTSRWRSRITRLTKQAGFPALKRLETFNWNNTTLPASLPKEDLKTARFATRVGVPQRSCPVLTFFLSSICRVRVST